MKGFGDDAREVLRRTLFLQAYHVLVFFDRHSSGLHDRRTLDDLHAYIAKRDEEGLTFKPKTDDMRDAPSFALVSALQNGGARVRVYDPERMAVARRLIEDIDVAANP